MRKIPVTRNFDKTDIIGFLNLRDDVDIPLDSVFSLSYHMITWKDRKPVEGIVHEVSLVSDSSYLEYVKHAKESEQSDE